ncbi:patatin-like phospholipase family protein [Allohahella marinimesophila]|uniref:Patatin-like phospholipase family protein n=1 Tax=Allohahella marinimesophila TaxID=1054972 RepID=A0ABP7PJE1_9GAMM
MSGLNKDGVRKKIALVLGGGGPLGGIYQIGALRALDEAIEGVDFNDLFTYVGTSSGAFVAANLANQMTTAQMCRIFVKHEADVHPFQPQIFFRPATREYLKRLMSVPGLFTKACSRFLENPKDQSFLEALTILAEAIPTGLFDNEGLNDYLQASYSLLGRTNDFRKLKRPLYLVAADIERGESVCFGSKGFAHIPISKAVQASVAAPGLYMPVEIDGRHYVDGTIRKGMHASIALDAGAELVLAINPVVPVDVNAAVQAGTMEPDMLLNRGLPNILAQSYRVMAHSRMVSGMRAHGQDYPNSNIVLFEPARNDAKLFFSSVFSFDSRRIVCEHAYQMTRHDLLARKDELSPILAKFGAHLNLDTLMDEQRTISTSLYGEMLPMYVARERRKRSRVKQGYLNKLGSSLGNVAERLL